MMMHALVFKGIAVLTLALLLPLNAAMATRIQEVVSPGGIKAWLVEEYAVPLIAVKAAFKGGASRDSEGKAGTANLVSGLLDEGAGPFDAETFQQRAEELAIKYGFDAGRDAFYADLATLKENAAEAFDLFRVALSEPHFTPDAVERIRGQVMSGLRASQNEPNAIAGRAWISQIFDGHPYGRPVSGTLDTVPKITPDDLRNFAGSTFARDNLVVAVVGAISAEELAVALDQMFGQLPQRSAPLSNAPVSLAETSFEEHIEADIAQTVIQFGGRGLARDDEDFVAAFVMNHILGGGTFSSRLYKEIREKRGLAYGVYTRLYPMDRAALFAGGVATRPERAEESLQIIRNEIGRIANEGPTAEELAAAKAFLKGSYPLRFDTSGKIAGQLLQIQIDGFGMDYIDRRNGLIDAVELADVQRAARRVFADGAPFVTVVGPNTKQPGSDG